MRVLIINPILYTPPPSGRIVHKMLSIKHTMIYNFALGFLKNGDEVTLLCSKEYEPLKDNSYDFDVLFFENRIKSIIPFFPNGFPVLRGLRHYLKSNYCHFDKIIVSESFSQGAYLSAKICPQRTIIWQEVAEYVPGKEIFCLFWYHIIVRFFMQKVTIVGRSPSAVRFIKRFANNVGDSYIEHGINTDIFQLSDFKEQYFIVLAQLIPRKRIDVTIRKFSDFCRIYSSEYRLFVVGGGPMEEYLKDYSRQMGVSDKVIFTGHLGQAEVASLLSKAKIMLTDTEAEYSMVSISEAIAAGTPVIANTNPYVSEIVAIYNLGIQDDNWDSKTIEQLLDNYDYYFSNCLEYREKLSHQTIAKKLLTI